MARIQASERQLRRQRGGLQLKHMIALLPLAVPIGIAGSHDTSRHQCDVVTDSKTCRDNLEGDTWSISQHPHPGREDESFLRHDSPRECFEGESSTCSADPIPGLRLVKQSSAAGTTEEASRVDTMPALKSRGEDGDRRPFKAAAARTFPSARALVPATALHSPRPPLGQAPSSSSLSAVLVVTLEDAHLAALMLATLRACGAMDIFQDFFIVGRGQELAQVEAILTYDGSYADEPSGEGILHAPEIIMVDERRLLLAAGVREVEARWSTCSLQMALKLLASSLVQTPFYLTLDSDVLCTKDKLSEQDLLPEGKGNYLPEGRNVHPEWWSASARTLRVEENPAGGGFGVTPAVLSTVGAKLTLRRLREVHANDDGFLVRVLNLWMGDPDRRWSEYTLYRTALDHFDAFDALHAVGTTKLLGENSVWYSSQFDGWNVTAAFDGESAAGFVVIQSTARIGVPRILNKIEQALESEGVPTPSSRSASSLPSKILGRMRGSATNRATQWTAT